MKSKITKPALVLFAFLMLILTTVCPAFAENKGDLYQPPTIVISDYNISITVNETKMCHVVETFQARLVADSDCEVFCIGRDFLGLRDLDSSGKHVETKIVMKNFVSESVYLYATDLFTYYYRLQPNLLDDDKANIFEVSYDLYYEGDNSDSFDELFLSIYDNTRFRCIEQSIANEVDGVTFDITFHDDISDYPFVFYSDNSFMERVENSLNYTVENSKTIKGVCTDLNYNSVDFRIELPDDFFAETELPEEEYSNLETPSLANLKESEDNDRFVWLFAGFMTTALIVMGIGVIITKKKFGDALNGR